MKAATWLFGVGGTVGWKVHQQHGYRYHQSRQWDGKMDAAKRPEADKAMRSVAAVSREVHAAVTAANELWLFLAQGSDW